MTDVLLIARRVIAGDIQDGDALALAQYVERMEGQFRDEALQKLKRIEEQQAVNRFLWGVEEYDEHDSD